MCVCRCACYLLDSCVQFMQDLGTHLSAAAAMTPRATQRAQFLHLLQISNGFCSLLLLSLSFSYFLRFCTRNSLRLRLRFVTFWPGIIWLWLWLSLWLWLCLPVNTASTCIRQISTRLVFILFILRCQLVLPLPLPPLPPLSLFSHFSLLVFCQQLCSWFEQIVMPCLPNTLPRLFCNT